jgi:hypothetical protein
MLGRADYKFWLIFAALGVAVLVACSSSSSTGVEKPDAHEGVADSMTHG